MVRMADFHEPFSYSRALHPQNLDIGYCLKNRGYCLIEIWILDITHRKGDIGVTEIWAILNYCAPSDILLDNSYNS